MKIDVCVQKHVSVEYNGISLFFYWGNKHQYDYLFFFFLFFVDYCKMGHFFFKSTKKEEKLNSVDQCYVFLQQIICISQSILSL